MQVFKFGGASVSTPEGVRNVANIIKRHAGEPLVVVVSAMGKMTNALELLAQHAAAGREEAAIAQFEYIRGFHQTFLNVLFNPTEKQEAEASIQPFYIDLDRIVKGILLLADFPSRFYDRIMAFGELISTRLLYHFLKQEGLPVHWADARKLVRTDTNYQSANVLYMQTEQNILREVVPVFSDGLTVIVQGYIGATSEEAHTTTLGREGSDYTAAIFGNVLNAKAVTIWKDVPGVMSADPKRFPDAKLLSNLTYEQAVEMTYYGASVIHPKTIKPLHDKSIPLYVKSFIRPEEPGTRVGEAIGAVASAQHPVTILKTDRALLSLRPRDFSFMEDHRIQEIFRYAISTGLEINLIQTTAITLKLCVKADQDVLTNFTAIASEAYMVEVQDGLSLLSRLNLLDQEAEVPENAVLVQREANRLHALFPENIAAIS